MDAADELRRKLQAMDSEKSTSQEESTALIEANKERIATLRADNKKMVARLRALKNPGLQKPGSRLGPEAIDQLDHLVCTLIKKHNQVRAKAESREKELLQLQKKFHELTVEQNWLKSNDEGEGPEAQRIRALETKLDKGMIKKREAVHVGTTYKKIIAKLQEDRLEFDNKLKDLEGTLSDRSDELKRLDGLCTEAVRARDTARKQLAHAEKTASVERGRRDKRKRDLNQAAEDQRRKYEAIERRLRGSSMGERRDDEETKDASVEDKLLSSEDMMRRIQEATGVMDVHEVLQRFRSQNETEAKLNKLKQENTETVQELEEKLEATTKAYEALKYSGEARNTSNQRMVAEFEQHLTAAKTTADTAEEVVQRNKHLLIQVETGIDHLHEKLDTLKPVQFRAAVLTKDKLKESELRLTELIGELDQRKGELVDVEEDEAPLVLPENNTRVVMATKTSTEQRKEDDEESEDEDAISRDQVKRKAQIMVETNLANQQPGGKRRGGR